MRRSRWLILCLCVLLITPLAAVRAQDVSSTPVTHIVVAGDTLARIAQRYGVTVNAILSVNPQITNPDLVRIGQAIIIPSVSAAQTGTPPAPTATIPITGTPPTATPTLTRTLLPTATGTPTFTPLPTNTPLPPGTIGPEPTLIPPIDAGIPFDIGGTVFAFSYPELMEQRGMTWARSQIRWNMGDPITAVQGAIEAARSRGFKSLVNITGTPSQIAGDPVGYYQTFAAFLGEVAALNPDAIEVWSAPNLPTGWAGGLINPAAYTELLRAAYEAIKRVNPSILVISGAPTDDPAFTGRCDANGCEVGQFLQGMAQAGADQAADCIGISYLNGAIPPTMNSGDPRGGTTNGFIPLINQYTAAFPNKPLCVTELGYFSGEGFDSLPAAYHWAVNTSAAEQAAWVSEGIRLAQGTGRVRMVIIYNIDATLYAQTNPQAGWAVVRPDGTCLLCEPSGSE